MENSKTLLFEQLVRINQLMGNNKDKYLISEQLWKSIASVIDNLSSGTRFADNAVSDAAKAIKRASFEADKVRAIATFINTLQNSATDATKLDGVLDEILANLDDVSEANLKNLETQFKNSVKNQGKLTDDMMSEYEAALRRSIDTPDQLSILKNKIIAKKVTDMRNSLKGVESSELAARGAAGDVRNMDFQIDSFNSIGRNKKPPITFDKDAVNKFNNLANNVEQMYLKGEYSFEQLSKFLRDNEKEVKAIDEVISTNAKTIENITGAATGSLGKAWNEIKKGIISVFDPKLMKALFYASCFGVLLGLGYVVGSLDQVALWGTGKAKKEIGMEDANCLSSVRGWESLDPDEIRSIGKIKVDGKYLGCENTKNDADPSVKLVSIKVIAPTNADNRTGFKLEFEDGHTVMGYPGGSGGSGGSGKTKTQEDGENFINSLNGEGEDLEGYTLKSWTALGDEKYTAVLENSSTGGEVTYTLKWNGSSFESL